MLGAAPSVAASKQAAANPAQTITTVSGHDATAMTDAAIALVKNGQVDVHAAASSLDVSEAKVLAIDTESGTFTSVTVPISGDYSFTSNFSVVFDSSGNLAQYGETLVSENEDGNFNVTTYADGVLTSDQDTDLAFMLDAELKQDMANSMSAVSAGFQTADKNTGACIATVLGLSGVAGAIIAYGCADACASAAIGIGVPFCVGCISGFAVIGGASITAVATCF